MRIIKRLVSLALILVLFSSVLTISALAAEEAFDVTQEAIVIAENTSKTDNYAAYNLLEKVYNFFHFALY